METDVLVTKYCLTSGVFRIKVVLDDDGFAHEVVDVAGSGYFLNRSEYALTEEEAELEFERQRQKKILSLKRNLTKLENKTFKLDESES